MTCVQFCDEKSVPGPIMLLTSLYRQHQAYITDAATTSAADNFQAHLRDKHVGGVRVRQLWYSMLVRYGAPHPFSPPATTVSHRYRCLQNRAAPGGILLTVRHIATVPRLTSSATAVAAPGPLRSCPPRAVCWLAQQIEASLRSGTSRVRRRAAIMAWPRSNPLLMPRRLVAGHRRSGDCHHRLWSGRATPTLVPPTTCADLTPPSANRSTSKSRTSGSTSTRPNRRANLKVVKTQSIGEVDYCVHSAEGGIACHTHSLVGAPRVIDWRALSEAQGCTRMG